MEPYSMPVTEDLWRCSECNNGPYDWRYEQSCAACGHTRCKKCSVANGRQQTPKIALHTAVEENDMDVVLQLLNNGADVNMKQDRMSSMRGSRLVRNIYHSDTPLHIAIRKGFLDIAKVLIENGADVNEKNLTLDTPLHFAVQNEYLEITKLLIENGADINVENQYLETPLNIAIRKGFLDIAKVLIENGADINVENQYLETPLNIAIRKGFLDIAKVLIENGADVNEKNLTLDTPLHFAVQNEYLEITKLLIENGADINVENQYLDTPLHIAIRKEFLDIAKVLIDNGADINAKNQYLASPLHVATQCGFLDIVKVLIENGADIYAKTRNIDTPLHIAIRKKFLDISRVLIENRADINVKNSDHDTPLHIAVQNGFLDIAKVLIENGANIDVKTQILDTPLHIAIRKEFLDIVKVLIENGADINVTDSDLDTPLHIAIKYSLLDTTRMLIEARADVNKKNRTLDTPLHIAVGRENLDIIALLLEKGANANIPRDSGHTALTLALQKQLHGVVEKLLQAGALTKESIREQVLSEQNVSQGITLEIVMDWDISYFMESGLSGVEDFRKAVTLTGSVQNAQMMSCEDYVAQIWGDSGLRILDILIRSLKSKTAITDDFDDHRVQFVLDKGLMKIVVEAPKGNIVDLMEQIAWLGCVFAREKTKSQHGPFLTTGSYFFSPMSGTYQLRIRSYPFQEYPIAPCWTKILRRATLAVGFPVRERPEGVGLEIPFPLLLRFADISVCMEYDGGTLFVGPSNILFPSRKLEDGIQWHIADATSAHEAAQVINQSPDWIRTDNIGQLVEHRAYLGYCSRAMVLLGTRDLLSSQAASDLFCGLDKSKSRIELVREGSMSAGFSYHGINTAIGGKWTIPPQLNVSLEDGRDLEDLLMNAHRRPVLVYAELGFSYGFDVFATSRCSSAVYTQRARDSPLLDWRI